MQKKTLQRALFALVAGTTFISLGIGGCLQATLAAIPIGAGFAIGTDLAANLPLGGLGGILGGGG